MKNRYIKNCQASKFLTIIKKFPLKLLPKLITEIYLYLLLKLASSLNWALKQAWVFVRNFCPRLGAYLDWAHHWALGTLSAI